MKRTHILATIILLLCSAVITTATAQISGSVEDIVTGKPVEYADVILLDKETKTVIDNISSESNGQFRFANIDAGEYSLMIRLIGYDIFTHEPIIINSSTPTFNIGVVKLQPLEIGLAEVVVEASRRQVIYKLDKRIIDASNNLMGSGGTAVDILENTPSIRVGVDGDYINK